MKSRSGALRYVIIVAILLLLMAAIVTGLWLRTSRPAPAAESSGKTDTSQTATDQPRIKDYSVKIAYIAIGDNGQSGAMIGCGDSVVMVDKTVASSSAIEGALRALLADKNEHYGQSGLYNVLWQSNLALDSVMVTNQVAQVALSGQLQLSGECDNPRVKAQIESTALQTGAATTVNVTLNGASLDDALSLK